MLPCGSRFYLSTICEETSSAFLGASLLRLFFITIPKLFLHAFCISSDIQKCLIIIIIIIIITTA